MSALPNRLTISVTDDQTLVLGGELDAHSAPRLAASLDDLDAAATITLDVSSLDFMDSSGLRVVIEADQRARESAGSLVLLRPNRALSKLLAVSGLASTLDIVDG